jgi:hypothetical protein
MAQDPMRDDHSDCQRNALDPSHDLDMVPLYRSATVDAEVEAETIRGILEVRGIPTIVWRGAGIPPLGIEIRVPRNRVEDARRAIAEQEEAGPEAAAEGEAASEGY